MLGDVLFVELDHIAVSAHRVDVAGSVANLTTDTVWVDPKSWRLEIDGREIAPASLPVVFEIPRHGVAYVEVSFAVSSAPEEARLIVGAVKGTRSPEYLGAIPLTRDPVTGDDGGVKQPRGRELLDRDCGSGPLVTCPR